MNWWEEIALSVVVGVLKNVIKNPTTSAKVKAAVREVADLAAQAAQALGA